MSFRRLLRVRATSEGTEREVAQELQFHIDSRIEDLVRQGMTTADAHDHALR